MSKKYALFGTGNTGSKIPELLDDGEEFTFFNSSNKPTAENLAGHDVIICFVPGPVLTDYLELFVSTGIPVVSGATAIDWPADWDETLKTHQLTWIWADNFSLGMNIVKTLINNISALSNLYHDPDFHIHEVHHVNKLDAPSGTAIRWQDWLERDSSISFERTGDVVGRHQLTLDTDYEQITISHEAKDRRIFAHGALWASRQLLAGGLPTGLLPLEYLTSMQRQGEYYVSN